MAQLVGVQVKQQAAVVIKHRGHGFHLHGIRIKQNTKVTQMPVCIQDNGVQNHHAAKGILTADGTKILQ